MKYFKTGLKFIWCFAYCSIGCVGFSQTGLITNVPGRHCFSLDGRWQYIIDPYETGIYDYRHKELPKNDGDAYWNRDNPANKTDRREYGYIDKNSLMVPGDWNSQNPEFLYYEGTVWYKKSFDFHKSKSSDRLFLYFGAVNYRADVYLNGTKLGAHTGGFTPFNFEIPDSLIKSRDNFLVVRVDNKRSAEGVPTLNTDWWNYGGITRDVKIIEMPAAAIRDYFIQLKPETRKGEVEGWVKLDSVISGDQVTIEIPALKLKKTFPVLHKQIPVHFILPSFQPWSPEAPFCYLVIISNASDRLEEKIGFRTIETRGREVLLNGKRIFMRGIDIHEEIPQQGRRAYSREDALQLLGWARELGCNMVRLAHYPHDESMTRLADSLGVLVWSEIPVYWTIDFSNKEVLENAEGQLHEMITRDHNRASIIIWSVGNETPVYAARTRFMKSLVDSARAMDPTRLLSAALEVNYHEGQQTHTVDDPLGAYLDLISFNEYLGWYGGGTPASCRTASWGTKYDKPLFISETGAGALGGFHGDSLTMWSEEYQEWYYKEQTAMFKRMPEGFAGVSPWILADFRSPRRNNPVYQEGWNRKGLIDQQGKKKKAFFILQDYYEEMKKR